MGHVKALSRLSWVQREWRPAAATYSNVGSEGRGHRKEGGAGPLCWEMFWKGGSMEQCWSLQAAQQVSCSQCGPFNRQGAGDGLILLLFLQMSFSFVVMTPPPLTHPLMT